MAELFVGPVMEKLIDACFAYLKDQVKWQTLMEEELKKLQKIHPQIQAVVSAYSQLEIEDPALNKWIWKLRDAIDEADDLLDEFEYRKLEEAAQKQESKNKKRNKVRSLMKSIKKRCVKICKRALKIDPYLKKLEVVVQNLYEISAEVSNFHHLLQGVKQEQQQQQLQLHKKRETGSMPTNDLLGRSKDIEFVRQWLTTNTYKAEITNTTDLYSKISLLSVVGLGGMGKTTLLQHVYEDEVTKEFDVKMWACVSDNFDVDTVITNILKSLKKENIELGSLEVLQRSLQSEVTSKKFLLVLDDIWEADETKWKNVLAPLHYGSLGSKILITTRMDSVASDIAKMIKKCKEILPLKGLEEDECFQLFSKHAFAGVENPEDELRSIAEKMVEKLYGCPLAAKVIGCILNSYVDKSYWTKILNTNIGMLESSQNGLLSILKLSYIYLPKFLQNCFAFCGIFSQDHEFDKDDLVRMWIALGFIQSSNIQGETLEDTGRRYFNILVQKSFFDEFHTYDDEVRYKMHDLLNELAQSVSKQECFKVVGNEEFSIPPGTIRHLAITTHNKSSLEATFQKTRKFKILRSLFLSFSNYAELVKYENVIFEILKASKNIRLLVINIESNYLQKMPEMIGCLIHLRYLKVPYGELKLLRSIRHLYHLQFIISGGLHNLEMDDIGWKELKTNENCQLITNRLVTKDPSMLLMEPLRSISSIRSLIIEENDELLSFLAETERWILQYRSSLFGLEFMRLKSLQSLPSSLESLSSLNTLRLYNVPQLKMLPNPPTSLTRLFLHNLESLQCLPSSLSTISSLKSLQLSNIPLLKSLPDLPPSLSWLSLDNLDNFDYLPSCLPTPLKVLWISSVPGLLELPDLPSSLEKLNLGNLKLLQCLPSCPPTLNGLYINEVPRLLELPDLPNSLNSLNLYELKSLQCLPSCLPTALKTLWIYKVPRLLELPDLPSSLEELDLRELESLQCLPSCLLTPLKKVRIYKVPRLLGLPDLPSSLKDLELRDLESLQCMPSCLPTALKILAIDEVPRLLELPDLPSSLKDLELRQLESLQCSPSCLPTALKILSIDEVPWLLELPDLPSSLKDLELRILESLQCLPSCLPTGLKRLSIDEVPRLLELPDLPCSMDQLYLRKLESLQCLPSCLPTLRKLWIIKVPRLLDLPDLPASLEFLDIEDCHPQLMERYKNFDVGNESNESNESNE